MKKTLIYGIILIDYNIIGESFLFNIGQTVSVQTANGLSPIVLAFIGDAVYSLYVRERLAIEHDYKSGELNKLAVSKVRASAQAERAVKVQEILTDDELAIFKRARNTKKGTKAKSASVSEYNLSTGFEALIGYLYIVGNIQRLNEILHYGEEDEG